MTSTVWIPRSRAQQFDGAAIACTVFPRPHIVAEDTATPTGHEQSALNLKIVQRNFEQMPQRRILARPFQFGEPFLFPRHIPTLKFSIDELHRVGHYRDLLGHLLDGRNQFIVGRMCVPKSLRIEALAQSIALKHRNGERGFESAAEAVRGSEA